jgi:tetratricopeptide (TPR) repeat protein
MPVCYILLMPENNKKIIAGSIAAIIVVLGLGLFLKKHEAVAPGPTQETKVTNEDEKTTGEEEGTILKEETASSTTSKNTKYVFTPYALSYEIPDVTVQLTAEQRKIVETKIDEINKTIASFDAKTSLPTRVDTLYMLAANQQLLGKYGASKKTLEGILGLGENAPILQSYASLLLRIGEPQAALRYINDAINVDPSELNFWITRIDIERVLYKNNLGALDATFQLALKKSQNNIDIVTLYARYLSEDMHQYAKAKTYWQKAMALNPGATSIYQSEIDQLP